MRGIPVRSTFNGATLIFRSAGFAGGFFAMLRMTIVLVWRTPKMPTLNLVTINGSTSEISKTGVLIDLALETFREKIAPRGIEVERTAIEMRSLRNDLASADNEEELSDVARKAIAALTKADLVIVGTPIYKASYSGMFKLFFDFVDRYAIANKPVLLTATGGTDRHALAIDTALRPLFGYLPGARRTGRDLRQRQ
jgi:FMN reductase